MKKFSSLLSSFYLSQDNLNQTCQESLMFFLAHFYLQFSWFSTFSWNVNIWYLGPFCNFKSTPHTFYYFTYDNLHPSGQLGNIFASFPDVIIFRGWSFSSTIFKFFSLLWAERRSLKESSSYNPNLLSTPQYFTSATK